MAAIYFSGVLFPFLILYILFVYKLYVEKGTKRIDITHFEKPLRWSFFCGRMIESRIEV